MSAVSTSLLQGLENSACYPHRVDQVRLIETHISWVLLTGSYAYKIKKPVKYSFVDFSTLDKRRWFCKEEVRLNRRLAPDLYLGVVSITGSPTSPEIDGPGPPFEFAVKMKQFAVEQEFHHRLADEENAEERMSLLADTIATFHSQIEQAEEDAPYGSPAIVLKAIKECLDEMPSQVLSQISQESLAILKTWLHAEWGDVSDIVLHRKSAGFVRECHGDLHLGNITIFKGSICVFDALEFEPRLRWIDVISEVAFLVMDLQKHGCPELASVFLNRYLERTGDYDGLQVFRLYQVYRALVRAKVAGLRLGQLAESGQEQTKANEELTEYIELANRFIDSSKPALILMHGVSGTGKTTVSTELIKSLGAIRIRSDIERKRLFSEPAKLKREVSEVVDLYHSDMTAHTYDRLRGLARALIQAGFVVIVDATFLQHHQRESFGLLANQLECGLFIMDVFAPQEVIGERIVQRSIEGRDASDATIDIMKRQQESEELLTQEEELHVIRVNSTDPESIVSAIRELQDNIKS